MKRVNVMKCVLVKEKAIQYEERVDCVEAAEEIFEKMIGNSAEEVFAMICVDTKAKITGYHEIAHGSVSSCYVDAGAIFKRALLNNAKSVIVAHNHPSGESEPSWEDIKMTKQLVAAGNLIEIDIADHIILGEENYSFRKYMPEVLDGRE